MWELPDKEFNAAILKGFHVQRQNILGEKNLENLSKDIEDIEKNLTAVIELKLPQK